MYLFSNNFIFKSAERTVFIIEFLKSYKFLKWEVGDLSNQGIINSWNTFRFVEI